VWHGVLWLSCGVVAAVPACTSGIPAGGRENSRTGLAGSGSWDGFCEPAVLWVVTVPLCES